jgi:hypothetical protein
MDTKQGLTNEERKLHQEIVKRAEALLAGGPGAVKPAGEVMDLTDALEALHDGIVALEEADEPAEVVRIALVELLHNTLFQVETDAESQSDLNHLVERDIRKNARERESLEKFRERTDRAAQDWFEQMVRERIAAASDEIYDDPQEEFRDRVEGGFDIPERLAERLRGCDCTLPADICSDLDLPQGTTYGQAVQS